MAIILGGVQLSGLAAQAGIEFGGSQMLAVHQLFGGGRVVDALGSSDADISWRGILQGPDALSNAQALDALRAGGETVPLSWDGVLYNVIVAELKFTYSNQWWISYRARCTITTPSGQTNGPTQNVAGSVVADLITASAWASTSGAQNAVAAGTPPQPGSPGFAAAAASLASLQSGLSASIAQTELALATQTPFTVVSAAGSLAGLVAAQSYILRACALYNGGNA